MNIEQKKLDFLNQIGTNNKSHSGVKLIDHLIGVHNILEKRGVPKYLQDAGLFHSVYGTVIFQHQSTNNRGAIIELIGEQAEKLVYEYSMLEHPRIESIYKIVDDQLREDLLLLDSANTEEESSKPGRGDMMTWGEAYDI